MPFQVIFGVVQIIVFLISKFQKASIGLPEAYTKSSKVGYRSTARKLQA
jgi:hypothetical protein